MNTENKKIFLIDAMALIYRAHFAFIRNPRINSKGINTSASFGFTNSLIEIIQKERPTHIIVAFDTYEPTFRHLAFEEYKANRDGQPEDITQAIPQIKKIIQAFNIPIIELPGYEADDIIGTIAYKLEKQDYKIYMMTPDKDFGQLVKENIYLYRPGNMFKQTEILDEKAILKKWNIKNVNQITDIIGLWGDASDNIPGVPGIGEKTSKKLIQEFGTIENLLNNIHTLKGKLKENLIKYSKQALDSKKLGTIDTQVPLKFKTEDAKYKEPNKNKLLKIFQELEFKTIIKRLYGATIKEQQQIDFSNSQNSTYKNLIKENEDFDFKINNINTTKHKYIIVNNINELQTLINKLSKQKEISLKVLGSNSNPHKAKLFGVAFSFKNNEAYYIHLPQKSKELNEYKNKLESILDNPKILKIGENIKYDIILLKRNQLNIKGPLCDIVIAHYLIEPDIKHDIPTMANMYIKYDLSHSEYFINENENINKENLNIIKENISEFADLILQIKNKLIPKLKIEEVEYLFWNIEMPLVQVLSNMELNGVTIDKQSLANLEIEIKEDLLNIEQKIYELAGEHFKINSPKQLGHILFDKMKLLENPQKTKGGQYATGENILTQLAPIHPIAKYLIQYKALSKLNSTYVHALPNMISKEDGKIHTTYNQAIVATGRLSSTDPNLQNIPIRSTRGKEIRKAFISSDPDFKIMSADYSQIELRIMASFSKAKHMIQAFKENKDIHIMTASKIFHVNEEDVTSDMRAKAKTVNFGIIYGISGFGLSKILEIRRRDAFEIINEYFKEFPDIKIYMDKVIEKAKQDGYVKTLLGKKRILKDINSRNATIRKYAERNAINSPMQGTQSEMIKLAMVNIFNWMKKQKLKSKMIMQVHDELIFEVHKDEIDLMKIQVEKLMKNSLKLEVPIEVNIGIGENWLEAH